MPIPCFWGFRSSWDTQIQERDEKGLTYLPARVPERLEAPVAWSHGLYSLHDDMINFIAYLFSWSATCFTHEVGSEQIM
jgi:hypothetical protein